jgi:hypothetical protein
MMIFCPPNQDIVQRSFFRLAPAFRDRHKATSSPQRVIVAMFVAKHGVLFERNKYIWLSREEVKGLPRKKRRLLFLRFRRSKRYLLSTHVSNTNNERKRRKHLMSPLVRWRRVEETSHTNISSCRASHTKCDTWTDQKIGATTARYTDQMASERKKRDGHGQLGRPSPQTTW